MRLMDVIMGDCHFKLAMDMVRDFVYYIDRPAFLKKDLVGFCVDMYQ
jgi:hypothetical protein